MDNEAGKLVKATQTTERRLEVNCADPKQTGANLRTRAPFRGRRFALALVSALFIALTVMATVAQELWAAIELAYYRGASTNNAVFLEWATVREVNINGFEILCKRVQDPETTYHPIGSRIALGSATSGATYNFDVTSGLIPGESYCFRLREITSDNTPGEAFDLCGYGLGITPMPTAVPVSVEVSIPVTLTPTAVTVMEVPGLTPAPTLGPTIDPFATPTITPSPIPSATVDPFATPTFTPTPTVEGQADSPLPTPTETVTQDVSLQDGQSSAAGLEVTEMPEEEPPPPDLPLPPELLTITPPPEELLPEGILPDEVLPEESATPTATATLTDTFPITNPQTGELPLVVDPNAAPAIPDNGGTMAMVEATPTPIYMVVTATPTPLPQVVAIPTFTPWPTAVPTQSFGLSNLLVPNTQNLMVGLLCLIFVSASGLGALGLVTSVLYMRSQTRRERLPGPLYDRRRY